MMLFVKTLVHSESLIWEGGTGDEHRKYSRQPVTEGSN